MGPQGPVKSGVGECLVTSARKRQDTCSVSHSPSSNCFFGDKVLCWLWADSGRREDRARPPGPSMAPTTGRRGRRRTQLLPGAELAPPCPAGPASPWPSSTASALRGEPARHSAQARGRAVHVCKCRKHVGEWGCAKTCGTRCRHRCKKDRKEGPPSGNQGIEVYEGESMRGTP